MNTSNTLSRTAQPTRQNVGAASDPVRLAAGECWAPRTSHPVTLLCTEGSLWWTQAGDARDHLLRAGERVTVRSTDRVVLQALSCAALVVHRMP